MKNYRHLSLDERETLLMLKAQGHSLRKIAFFLSRSPSSLSREIKRNRIRIGFWPTYRPAKAHGQARFRLRTKHRKSSPLNKDMALQSKVVQLLENRWSPELISGRLKLEAGHLVVSHEAIYRWIYSHARHLIPSLLRSHPKRWPRLSRSRTNRIIPRRISIHQRPPEINRRESPGHWEADLVWGQSRAALQVLVERKTRLTRLKKLPNKSAQAAFGAISDVFSGIPPALRRSITYDNGSENFLHAHLNNTLSLDSYFCDPFQAWQKGTVENTNGLIRRFLPKRTNLDTLPESNIQKIEDWLNNRPRKILDFQTPAEAFNKAVVALAT